MPKYNQIKVDTSNHLCTRVWIDDVEVKGLHRVTMEHVVDGMPTLHLEMVTANLVIDGVADVTHLSSVAREYCKPLL